MPLAVDDMRMRLGWLRPDEPDPRDFSMRKAIELSKPPDDALADKTIREAYHEGYFGSWKAILAFWRWIKSFFGGHTPEPKPKRKKSWFDPEQLDQGNTPHCVGFGATHFLDTDPVFDHELGDYAHELYYACKVIDGEPLEENGTYVHTVAKVLKNRGRISTYVWARNGHDGVEDIKEWILNHGSVIVGTDWLYDMFFPDANGRVYVGGPFQGGHCYLILGYDEETDLFECQNSWGEGFGIKGHFWMSAADLASLLDFTAEACATTELPLAAFVG